MPQHPRGNCAPGRADGVEFVRRRAGRQAFDSLRRERQREVAARPDVRAVERHQKSLISFSG